MGVEKTQVVTSEHGQVTISNRGSGERAHQLTLVRETQSGIPAGDGEVYLLGNDELRAICEYAAEFKLCYRRSGKPRKAAVKKATPA